MTATPDAQHIPIDVLLNQPGCIRDDGVIIDDFKTLPHLTAAHADSYYTPEILRQPIETQLRRQSYALSLDYSDSPPIKYYIWNQNFGEHLEYSQERGVYLKGHGDAYNYSSTVSLTGLVDALTRYTGTNRESVVRELRRVMNGRRTQAENIPLPTAS